MRRNSRLIGRKQKEELNKEEQRVIEEEVQKLKSDTKRNATMRIPCV